MNKRILALVIAAGLLGGGLVWGADRKEDSGISGWETLNVSMAQALGSVDKEATAAAAVAGGGRVKDSKELGEEHGEKAAGTGKEGAASAVAAANAAGGGGAIAAGTNGAAESAAGSSKAAGVTGSSASAASEAASPSQASADGKINVNTADAAALMNLPGIGAKKAQAMIDYRSSKGAFRSLSDLGEVKGIGPKLLEKLKPLVIF